MRSLYSGVTGIRSHQMRMDVIGNNIANVNTVGFKGSRVSFTDVMSQTLSSGSQMTNPMQIGLGVGVGSTDLITDDGSFQMTGRALDLAIQGSGLFVLKGNDGQVLYTRAGSFDWNTDGYLFNPANGMRVQGWMADPETGEIGRTDMGTLTDIRMVRGDVSLASPSTESTMKGNLDAAAAVGTKYETAFTAYDSLGRPIPITLQFERTATGWDWRYASSYTPLSDPTDPTSEPAWETGAGATSLTFSTAGKLVFDPTNPATYTGEITITDPSGAAAAITLDIDFRAITQAYATSNDSTSGNNSTVQIDTIDGTRMGILESVFIDESGVITGRFTNGTSRVLAQIALANFNNMGGLTKVGGSTFAESPASGVPSVGRPNTGGRGGLVPGNLEGSNVDLAAEFTNMIMTQRGFQASTKLVTTADDMLQELINLRR
ncbi:MAG: flagellar hook protein FlgE [Bacillota bacterium]